MNPHFEEIHIPGYEKILKVTEKESGLLAAIAIHDTTLGPALGGTRIYPYETFESALNDVLRLSKGMTYKSAIAEAGLGGGKSVIVASPQQKTKKLLHAFGKAIDMLKGQYVCAEDVGCNEHDVACIREMTPYVVGLPEKSGDPSRFTAWGVYRGIQSVMKWLFDSPSVEGKKIAVQGLGQVGRILSEILFWQGADLTITDIREEHAKELAARLGAKYCPPDQILMAECDIFAPCALGGILNSKTIPLLRCKAVAGGANNQLLDDDHATQLSERGILYAPDFIINSGGLINVLGELEPEGYNSAAALRKVNKIYEWLIGVYEIAEQNRFSTQEAALALANYRIRYKIGKRNESLSPALA